MPGPNAIGRRAPRLVGLALAGLALISCDSLRGEDPPPVQGIPTEPPVLCGDVGRASPALGLEVVASGLEVPWAMDFAPDGRIFFTERVGRIRVIENGKLREEPWAELPVSATDENGLMGIALAPDFAESGHVFVQGTFQLPARSGLAELFERARRKVARAVWLAPESSYRNRVHRFSDREGRGVDPRLIIDDLPSHRFHAGGALAFGPDGMLYVSVGEALDRPMAQQTRSLAGKILRYRPDGSVPEDNPFPGSPVYALGMRNSQGLAWHPETGQMLASEHGAGPDEFNWIRPGANYGWPLIWGHGGEPTYASPLWVWARTRAPSGLAIYSGDRLPWHGDALIGGLGSQMLIRLALETGAGGPRVVCSEDLFERQVGRIRGVAVDPSGQVYLTTSNRDKRIEPAASDDRLLRVVRR